MGERQAKEATLVGHSPDDRHIGPPNMLGVEGGIGLNKMDGACKGGVCKASTAAAASFFFCVPKVWGGSDQTPVERRKRNAA